MNRITHPEALLSSADVCGLAGCSYRQLTYWCSTGVMAPTVPSRGSGTSRRFALLEAAIARVLTILAAHGADGTVLRRVAEWLTTDEAIWNCAVRVDRRGRLHPEVRGMWPQTDGWVVDLPRAWADVHFPSPQGEQNEVALSA